MNVIPAVPDGEKTPGRASECRDLQTGTAFRNRKWTIMTFDVNKHILYIEYIYKSAFLNQEYIGLVLVCHLHQTGKFRQVRSPDINLFVALGFSHSWERGSLHTFILVCWFLLLFLPLMCKISN